MCLELVFGLFAGLERQRLGELYRDSACKLVHVVDSADSSLTDETCHIKGIIRAESRHAESRDDILAGMRALIVCLAGEGCAAAGYIDHLAL